ncbi:MAG: hypothetical protein PHX43_08815, partial [Alphaproteobacteria bacterium]|nr:hypothetical protein [Alphaproteobacteria bacterium]
QLDVENLKRAVYFNGADVVRGAILLFAAKADVDPAPMIAQIEGWVAPQFPVKGEDLVERGVAPGPQVGELLREIEAWWIEQNFKPSKDECLRRIV